VPASQAAIDATVALARRRSPRPKTAVVRTHRTRDATAAPTAMPRMKAVSIEEKA
jgi:hypothetical protein